MVDDVCSAYAEKEAIVDGEERILFADLRARVDEVARAAIASGVSVGDRIAIWAPNSARWIITAFGALAAGAAIVPLNTRYKGQEAAHILQKSGASVLFTVTDFLDTDYVALLRSSLAAAGDEGIAELPDLGRIVLISGDARDTVGWESFIAGGATVTDGDL